MAARKTKSTSKKSTETRAKRGASKTSIGPQSSLSTLKKLAHTKKKQYLHSENTTEKYDGYVKRGKEFLQSFFEEESEAEANWKAAADKELSGDGEEEIDEDENLLRDPEFRNAFNGPPVKSTPQAIAMFLAWKCFEQNNGKSTADGIHAAFIAEYDQM
jgi:hypothetical protein